MSAFIKKPKLSLSEKRKKHFYNPWGMRDVIEAFSRKSYEQVVQEQKERREKKS